MIKNLFPKMRDEYFEKDFEKTFTKEKIEEIHMKNIFCKKKMKNVINSNIETNNIDEYNDILNTNINEDINNYRNRIKDFSNYSEDCQKFGEEYYKKFLALLNNYSNEFQEDVEISIYDNLKEKNNFRENNLLIIMDMVNEYINGNESKKGFLALLKQSFLLGKLRTYIVSIYTFIFFYFIGKRIYYWHIWKKKSR